MDTSQSLDSSQKAIDRLTPREKTLYQASLTLARRPLSASLRAGLYNLYLNGSTCEEIHRINSQVLTLSEVIRVRVEDDWDERVDRYRQSLMDGIDLKSKQVHLESVSFVTEQLAALHKLNGDKVKKFLMTGDPAMLEGALLITNMKAYKETAELLLQLTGRDGKKPDKDDSTAKEVKAAAEVHGALRPRAAALLLRALEVNAEEIAEEEEKSNGK